MSASDPRRLETPALAFGLLLATARAHSDWESNFEVKSESHAALLGRGVAGKAAPESNGGGGHDCPGGPWPFLLGPSPHGLGAGGPGNMAVVALVTSMNLKLKAGAPTDQSPPLGATPEWLNGAAQGKVLS